MDGYVFPLRYSLAYIRRGRLGIFFAIYCAPSRPASRLSPSSQRVLSRCRLSLPFTDSCPPPTAHLAPSSVMVQEERYRITFAWRRVTEEPVKTHEFFCVLYNERNFMYCVDERLRMATLPNVDSAVDIFRRGIQQIDPAARIYLTIRVSPKAPVELSAVDYLVEKLCPIRGWDLFAVEFPQSEHIAPRSCPESGTPRRSFGNALEEHSSWLRHSREGASGFKAAQMKCPRHGFLFASSRASGSCVQTYVARLLPRTSSFFR